MFNGSSFVSTKLLFTKIFGDETLSVMFVEGFSIGKNQVAAGGRLSLFC